MGEDEKHPMSAKLDSEIAVIGIDHAGSWQDGSPTCRRVSSAWRLASGRII
jgi:hypothetical protein